MDNRLAAVQCIFQTSTVPILLSNLLVSANESLPANNKIGFDTGLALEAWGGPGGEGGDRQIWPCSRCQRGPAGARGYARTALTFGNLLSRTAAAELYAYVGNRGTQGNSFYGGKGGSSTVVIGQALTDGMLDPNLDPEDALVVLMAGGGGGGGACTQCSSGPGGTGGAGACAIAKTAAAEISGCKVAAGENATAGGADGGDGTRGAPGGRGGNPDGTGGGGAGLGGADGNAGIGGKGGKNGRDDNLPEGWSGTTVDDWGGGEGGEGKNNACFGATPGRGGGGGGGYGGGGGGSCDVTGSCCTTDTRGAGGAGAGSWSLAATVDETGIPFIGTSGAGVSAGGFAMTFDLATGTLGSAVASTTKFEGVVKKLSATKLRIKGDFETDAMVNLGNAIIRLERLLAYDGIELAKSLDGRSLSLLTLGDPEVSNAKKLGYDKMVNGTRIRLELKQKRESEVSLDLKVDGVLVYTPPTCSDGSELTPELETRIVLDDGENPRAVLSTTQPWECRDNKLKSIDGAAKSG